jgi:splicing factor 3B subunit 2
LKQGNTAFSPPTRRHDLERTQQLQFESLEMATRGAEAGSGEGAAGAGAGRRLTKNEKRRQKKKEQPPTGSGGGSQEDNANDHSSTNGSGESKTQPEVEVEYVSADLSLLQDPVYEQFKQIFEKFANPEELTKDVVPSNEEDEEGHQNYGTDYQQDEHQSAPPVKKLSKKKKRLMSRLSVAELKQLVQRPDVVEAHDVTSSDPRLLVFLKGMRNTVPVPRHWCHKRKYLQGKRGIEKPPFRLPEYIADTGIARIRESILESDAMKKSKTKARERMQPKMGKIDIDYQVLHDAFFKFQTKPKLTEHGDLYFEGKEFEVSGTVFVDC